MRIDAHQHFWDPVRGDYDWMDALQGQAAERLLRPFWPADLEPILARHDIDRTVLVQAAPTEAEAEFLLALAGRHSFIAGAVIWLDMESANFEKRLETFSKHPKFLGIRPMIQDIADPRWMLGQRVREAFAVLQRTGTCFDFLIKPAQLESTLEILSEFSELRAVIDHIAKPNIARGEMSPWCELMRQVASHERVYCKLSGMITEADHAAWKVSDLAPFIEHAVTCFGPSRLMFGSDWPVCTLAGSYERVVSALVTNLEALRLDAAAMARIFGGSAREFYRLP